MRAAGSEQSTARLWLDFLSMDPIMWTAVHHQGLELLQFTFKTKGKEHLIVLKNKKQKAVALLWKSEM